MCPLRVEIMTNGYIIANTDFALKGSTSSLSETIYQHIVDMILSLQIKPGEKISEAKIAKEFNVSRTPIREALKKLAHDGIINIYPNRFARVASYTPDYIKQIGIVRLSLETMAVKLAIHNGSNSEFLNLRKYCEQCYKAASIGDTSSRIKMDCTFHFELCKISKNQQLIDFQREIYFKIEFIQACQNVTFQLPDDQHKDHEDIVNNLLDRNEEKVTSILIKHCGDFHNIIKDYPPNFFYSY